MSSIKKCTSCNVVVIIGMDTVNMHCCHYDGKTCHYICIDCAKDYFDELDEKDYRAWCKHKNIKFNKKDLREITEMERREMLDELNKDIKERINQ
jgi:hypothetical protein